MLLSLSLIFFSGGLCNLIYHCSLPSHVKPKGNEPAEVLMRVFGKDLDENDHESSESYLTGLVNIDQSRLAAVLSRYSKKQRKQEDSLTLLCPPFRS